MKFQDYFERFGYRDLSISQTPDDELSLVVVIPCCDENDIIKTLDSLEACSSFTGGAEVIIVLNHSIHADQATKVSNEQTLSNLNKWIENEPRLTYHLIEAFDLPQKHAGVGLARKIGMDEAAFRLEQSNKKGVIVCLDADCTVGKNYLKAIENHVQNNPNSSCFSIYYEHPIDGAEHEQVFYEGIVQYELFLRLYIYQQEKMGLPYAFHTVGSSMAVRPEAYMKQGGMNKKKAGEDFYFISKMLKLGHFTACNTTCVHPSPRISSRVPFGTGKAMGDWAQGADQKMCCYSYKSFALIHDWLSHKDEIIEGNTDGTENAVWSDFLQQNDLQHAMKRIKANTAHEATKNQKFYEWFDGFRLMKGLHFLRDQLYKDSSVLDLAQRSSGINFDSERAALTHFRNRERQL